MASVAIVLGFWLSVSAIITLRERVVQHRPGQYVHADVLSRVEFTARNAEREIELQQEARDAAPRVYRRNAGAFSELERQLASLPEAASDRPERLPRDMHLDSGAITALKKVHLESADAYRNWVRAYADDLRTLADRGKLVLLRYEDREVEVLADSRDRNGTADDVRRIRIIGSGPAAEASLLSVSQTLAVRPADGEGRSTTWPSQLLRGQLLQEVVPVAEKHFIDPLLSSSIAALTVDAMQPTHLLDPDLTIAEQNAAASRVSLAPASRHISRTTVLVPRQSEITPALWKLLSLEQREYIRSLTWQKRLVMHAGMAGIAGLICAALSAYAAGFQPKLIRNHLRAVAIVALLLAMLLVAQLAAIGTGPLLVFGVAPSILAAMILAIAYDQRFAMGVGTLHALLVTAAVGQGVGFFMVVWVGVFTCCYLLDEVRTRSKLIEVGGVTALTMAAAAAAVGAAGGDPVHLIGRDALHVSAAGLGVGFVVLGILPFIERTFRITTSMTLLELADASQPLLRRLAMEAPGTYSHSLQVAALAEAAAESIGADALLCRVGSYYHDIGKMNKADYFCENQMDGRNRHLNLSPSVSLLIIIGHVKDGVELAKEYNLPTVILPVIQQHHGTTLVEYFYHQAVNRHDESEGGGVSEIQYRYPGPKPRSRETAIVMIADIVESATRSMVEPTPARIEALVHELVMKRLLDGQFDEADITIAELQQVERSVIKTLLALYHGRLAYPSTARMTQRAGVGAAKTAG